MRKACWITALLGWAVCAFAPSAAARDALAAVATNFVTPMRALTADFQAKTSYEIDIASGSTGKLYAQIKAGAPFDVFLAADADRPRRLVEEGLAEARVAYAHGRLVLWGPRQSPGGAPEDRLSADDWRRLAIANPKLAPYGAAAVQALDALGVGETASPRLVFGENVGQAYAMAASGAAEFGLIALSQHIEAAPQKGYAWIIPETLHTPIAQDAVLLSRASENDAARAFMTYLASDAAAEIIQAHGYDRR